jgi:hypothetical protein
MLHYRGGGKGKKVLHFQKRRKKCIIEVCLLTPFAKTKNCQSNTFEIKNSMYGRRRYFVLNAKT